MKYKYSNEAHTAFNVFVDGSLKKAYPRVTEGILEREGITLDDIEPYIEPIINYDTAHKAACMAYQKSKIDDNLFPAMMAIKGVAEITGIIGDKAAANLAWLKKLWDDKDVRVTAESDNYDYSNHGNKPHGWKEIEAEATGGE
jgi:hypothetical protein